MLRFGRPSMSGRSPLQAGEKLVIKIAHKQTSRHAIPQDDSTDINGVTAGQASPETPVAHWVRIAGTAEMVQDSPMTMIQSMLLASAAGLAAVASAAAAELPSKKAAPVDYVKVCNVAGITGWTLPGSDVCMRLSGYVSAEVTAGTIGPSFGYGVTAPWANLGGVAVLPKKAQFAGPKTWSPGPRVLIGSTDAFNRNATLLTTRGNTSLDFATDTPYGPLVGHFDVNSDLRPPQ